MTTGSDSRDARSSAAEERFERPSRRRVLASLGGATAAALGGCLGAGGSSSSYVDGQIDASEINATNGTRSASEMSAASSLADTQTTDSASPLESLELGDHEFVVNDGYKGAAVEGTVTNTAEDTVKLVEVRVRVYDDSGTYLGQYMDSVGDVASGTTWQFEVIVLASLDSVASYDIGVFGVPE